MRKRLDIILVDRGYAASREKAKALILSGSVRADGRSVSKPGAFYEENDVALEVEGGLGYVSRGGLKLEKAVEVWGLSLEGLVCMDVGASTGGFTDCMLQNGAAKVYSVDVGRDQLAAVLREDERVVCMEQTNFRYISREDIPQRPDFVSADVSFISLTRILPPAGELLKDGGKMVCLIKPQFEAGPGRVGKNGVVRDPQTHRDVIKKIVDFADGAGFLPLGLEYSPVRGPEGNIEYLLLLEKRREMAEGARGMAEGARGMAEGARGTAEGAQGAAEAFREPDREGERLSESPLWKKRIEEVVESSHML